MIEHNIRLRKATDGLYLRHSKLEVKECLLRISDPVHFQTLPFSHQF